MHDLPSSAIFFIKKQNFNKYLYYLQEYGKLNIEIRCENNAKVFIKSIGSDFQSKFEISAKEPENFELLKPGIYFILITANEYFDCFMKVKMEPEMIKTVFVQLIQDLDYNSGKESKIRCFVNEDNVKRLIEE